MEFLFKASKMTFQVGFVALQIPHKNQQQF